MSVVNARIIVHGGAFNIPPSFEKRYREGTKEAAKVGYDVLATGGTAIDAVEQAVRSLENNSAFNAGHGSVLTEAGTVEMDAIIVDGTNLKTGAVACVENIANPVSLARMVMEKTSHCLICGAGAMQFARKMNVEILKDPLSLVTEDTLKKTLALRNNGTYDEEIADYVNNLIKQEGIVKTMQNLEKEKFQKEGHDTVGAVAIDTRGNIACATSTGGLPGKMVGRVGDSPIFGSGAYANTEGGCSSTGHGESLIKSIICREAVSNLENGSDPMEATENAIAKMYKATGSRGGVIMIDKHGRMGYAFNSSQMAWATVCGNEVSSGLFPDEIL